MQRSPVVALERTECKYLHEEDVSGGIRASVYNKRLLLDVTASTGPDGQLSAVLKQYRYSSVQLVKNCS